MSNVLILAAHPDDESLGCGATIAKLAAEGHQITLLTFTDGVSARSNNKSINRSEFKTKLTKISTIIKNIKNNGKKNTH